MAFCGNCGKKLKDGAKFCPFCGASADGKPAKRAAQVEEVQASPEDAEQNKGMAIIAYLLFFVPLITGDYKKSPFVKFHTNQGTLLAIVSIGLWIVWLIIRAILQAIIRGMFSGGSISYSSARRILGAYEALANLARVANVVTTIYLILILLLLALGIFHAVTGKMKRLPLIGKRTIIK